MSKEEDVSMLQRNDEFLTLGVESNQNNVTCQARSQRGSSYSYITAMECKIMIEMSL